jgi:hypothetical protein
MTSFHREQLICPKCLNEAEVVCWDRVDVSADPDLKDRLLRRNLMSFECPNCGEFLTNANPLLYIDPAQRVQIFYSPTVAALEAELAADAAEAGVLPQALRDELQVLSEAGAETSDHLRLVAGINSLMEKIHLFDHGYDDRLMEILKIALKVHYFNEENMTLEQIYFLSTDDEVVLFQAKTAEKGWYSLEMSADIYQNTKENLVAQMPLESSWALINEAWATAWLKQHG